MKREKRTAKGGNDANNVCDHLLASADFKVYFHIITGIICDYPGCFSKKSVMIAGSMVKTLSISGVCCEAEMKGTWRFCIFWSVQGPGSRIQFDIPRDRFSLLSISQMFMHVWCMCVDVWTTQAYSHIVCRLKQLMQRQLKTTASCWNNQYFSASWAPGGKQHCVSFMLTSVFFQHMPCELL